ncbi:MAG: cytochrome c3 family protein [Melioribacteraceae bacterium]|nr:cytochrome c3 family protein [Melioribacteraceae bacterium]
MKTKVFYISLFAALTALWFAGSVNSIADDLKSNKNIIKFSHQLHTELEVGCADCHTGVPESTALSDRLLPEKDICAGCHDVEDDESCNTCHYEDTYEPFVSEPSKLIFSHQFHVTESEMECQACHKGLEEVDYSTDLTSANPSMMICYQCHNDQSVAVNVCESCHIATSDLTPESHKTANFFRNHKFSSNHPDAECAMCHDNSFCEDCHVATTALDVNNTALDFYTPYSPHRIIDGAKQQQITRVHDLNYRFTHGMDLKGKSFECSTCHQTEIFCAECHNPPSSGDYALGGIMPQSHSNPNFFTYGVGSGGGLHAELARRDIERCASCHDTQGADPSCILCHSDPDGIRGNNSRTHKLGFMKNINGDWHGDTGAVCYDCHTDPFALNQQAGQGFCGYCHN